MNTNDTDARALMMAVLDDEADAEQRRRFAELLTDNATLQREFDELTSLKELTMNNKPRDPDDELWQSYWGGVYRRIERGTGWLLMSAGLIMLFLYGGWEFAREWLTSPDIPLWVKLGGVFAGSGLVILFVSILRETLFHHKHERYKDIER
ncbi:MAG: hypothetical protein WD071_17335 [Pseudohongiella sp.]|uniref:anti-sigma factor n=1 Tax=Pseudohongiella sp. TaxID=1979412 RepID=UPI0034A00A52